MVYLRRRIFPTGISRDGAAYTDASMRVLHTHGELFCTDPVRF